MVFYLGEKIIRRVAILGGTHGNERIGPALVQWWVDHPDEITRPSFTTTTLVANPAAVRKNVRYVDSDLNRAFDTHAPPNPATEEGRRAAELDALLGPKVGPKGPAAADFIIDMHSTTSNMGLTVILPSDHDLLALRVAAAMRSSLSDPVQV